MDEMNIGLGIPEGDVGNDMPEEMTPIAEQTVPMEVPVEPVAEEQPAAQVFDAPEYTQPIFATPTAGSTPVAASAPPAPILPKKKSKLPLIIAGVVGALAVAAVVIVLLLPGGAGIVGSEQKEAIEQADTYLASGQYRQAMDTLMAVETNDDVEAAIAKVYKAVENEVKELVKDEEYEDALELLNDWTDLPEYENLCGKAVTKEFEALLEEEEYLEAFEFLDQWESLSFYSELCDDGLEKAVYGLMDSGEYEEAFNLAKQYPDAEKYADLKNQIMAETVILECAFNLRPSMKNPTSLQISEAELYVFEGTVDADYPQVILHTSGQNGFGGYATSWTIYDAEDLAYVGSTSTLSMSDADDVYEMLVIGLIEAYRDFEEIKVEYDLSRINSFLSSGKKPNMDITQFKNASYSSV